MNSSIGARRTHAHAAPDPCDASCPAHDPSEQRCPCGRPPLCDSEPPTCEEWASDEFWAQMEAEARAHREAFGREVQLESDVWEYVREDPS